jgi:hypothetical protein
MNEKILKIGKLSSIFLTDLFQYKGAEDKSVILGPSIGEDAAVIDFDKNSEKYCERDEITKIFE